jgi:hypothetical protein
MLDPRNQKLISEKQNKFIVKTLKEKKEDYSLMSDILGEEFL